MHFVFLARNCFFGEKKLIGQSTASSYGEHENNLDESSNNTQQIDLDKQTATEETSIEMDKNVCNEQKHDEDHLVPDKSTPTSSSPSSGEHETSPDELLNNTQLHSLDNQTVPDADDNLKPSATLKSSSNDPVDVKVQQQEIEPAPKPSSKMSTSKRNNSSRQNKSTKHEHNKLNKSDMVTSQSSPSLSSSNAALPKSLSSSSSLSHQQQQRLYEDLVVYEFNFPRKYCGKLIGKNGVHVDFIRFKTKTQIAVRDDPNVDDLQIVCVSGRLEDVDHALDIISSRFPQKNYPTVSFKPISKPIVYRRRFNADKKSLFDESKVLVAPNMFVSLESVINPTAKADVNSSSNEHNSTRSSSTSSTSPTTDTTTNDLFAVHVSAVVNSSLVFAQLPSNPTYENLQKLEKNMLKVYSEDDYEHLNDTHDDKNNNEEKTTDAIGDGKSERKIPYMSEPIEFGSICVAPTSYGWHRAMVTNYVSKQDACEQFADYSQSCGQATVKFLDYGGYLTIPANQLRQLRSDFMLLPFQAIECYLDGIFPYKGLEEEGKRFLTELIKGGSLKASLSGYAEDGIPLIKLYLTNETCQNLYVNAELVKNNFAYYYDNNNNQLQTTTTTTTAVPVDPSTTTASISNNDNDNNSNTNTTSPS